MIIFCTFIFLPPVSIESAHNLAPQEFYNYFNMEPEAPRPTTILTSVTTHLMRARTRFHCFPSLFSTLT